MQVEVQMTMTVSADDMLRIISKETGQDINTRNATIKTNVNYSGESESFVITWKNSAKERDSWDR